MKFFIRIGSHVPQEVTEQEYCEVERSQGLLPKSGSGPATGAFSFGPIRGWVLHELIFKETAQATQAEQEEWEIIHGRLGQG